MYVNLLFINDILDANSVAQKATYLKESSQLYIIEEKYR